MRDQAVVRAVDALASQQRVILWLACKHTVTITKREVEVMSPAQAVGLFSRETWPCPHCPDPPPPVPEDPRRVKSARQLWREAGEP